LRRINTLLAGADCQPKNNSPESQSLLPLALATRRGGAQRWLRSWR
jgi:hypothetical protein